MTLGQRLRTVLAERGVKQVEFAKALGISANYANLIVNDKKSTISETLAKLMEETYGFSAEWILSGTGEKYSVNGISAEKAEVLKKIQRMSDGEVRAVLAFVNSLESLKEREEG